MTTLDFADSDDPIPTRTIAPSWLVEGYRRRSRAALWIGEPGFTHAAIGQQQAAMRRASRRWHAALELDFGVVVDAATGVYVYSDERRAVAPKPKRMRAAKAPKIARFEKCSRCASRAVVGKTSCANHLEWDRLRRKNDEGRERNREAQRKARAA